ncbi:MAG: hypothetical protein PF588_00815 [Candidatus Kapabacteria bacterium]|nr:hypothetical protein [Candidatus Kapabacteria bacterium]
MKIFLVYLLIGTLTFGIVSAEEKDSFSPSGKPFAKIFMNYHYDMTADVDGASNFEIKRAYLGYKYSFSSDISAKITMDVGSNMGSNEEGSEYTAYLKAAQLDWKIVSPLKLSVGLIGLKQFNDQEKFWGYRFIYKSFQDQHKFGSSADLGANLEIAPMKMLKVNLLVVNGEGYKNVQDEYGTHRIGANVVATPLDGLTLKAYYDMMTAKEDNGTEIVDSPTISNLSFFAGYKIKDAFRVGFEYNKLMNGKKYSSAAEDHELNGISAYATYIINKKFEVFGRFDQLSSNTLANADTEWNLEDNGNLILLGLQYSPVKGVKTALNFRTWMHADSDVDASSQIYLNFEYKL